MGIKLNLEERKEMEKKEKKIKIREERSHGGM